MIAKPLIREHFIEWNLLTASKQIGVAAARPLLFIGRKKNLALRVWKDDRALIATFRNHVDVCRRRPLPRDKLRPHGGIVSCIMNGVCDFESADRGRYIT